MPINDYAKIRDVIANQPTNNTDPIGVIEVQYDQDPLGKHRMLIPYVIGKSTPNNSEIEMVLCYQYDNDVNPGQITIPHPSRENYRCFRVSSLKFIQVITFVTKNPPPPDGQKWRPKNISPKHLKKQNCVEAVDVSF
jgi:hypothetical protein